ncbi:MAG: MFS transporter [Chloroflexia bacterium]
MLTMFAAVYVMGAALVAVVLPVYARESFGQAVGLGLMLSGFGGGSLVGALLYGALAGRLPRRPTFLLAFAGLGLPFFALAAEPGLWVSVGLLALVGMANAPIAVIAVSVIQMRTPPDMRGRVMGLETALTSIAAPLGPLAGGLAIQWLGVSVTLLVVAAGMVAIPLLNVANPTLRDLNLQSATEVVSSGAVAEQVAP